MGSDFSVEKKIDFMNRLALGTVQFGLDYGIANQTGRPDNEEAGRILKVAKEAGINMLDTAIAYGESEQVLRKLGTRDFRIVTKPPSLPPDTTDIQTWIDEQIQVSMDRLGVQSVYGVLLHGSQDLLSHSGRQLATALNRLKTDGKTKKIGVSIYGPEDLERVTEVLNVDLIQAPLNLLDRRLEMSGWLKRLHETGVEIHARSAFLQGLLLMPRHEIPAKFERWSKIWDAWHHHLAESEITATANCLSYPLSLPEIDHVVVGVDSVKQLRALILDSQSEIKTTDWSFMRSDDEQLINPSRWNSL